MKKLVVIGVAVIVLLLAAGGVFVVQMSRYLDSPMQIAPQGADFHIRSGMSFAAIAGQLNERGMLSHPSWFRAHARLTGVAGNVQAGHYRLVQGDTPRTVLEKFVNGTVELVSFTIVEGWNVRELLDAIASSDVIRTTLEYDDLPQFLETLGAQQSHPEGLFLPETYKLPKYSDDTELLQQAYRHMQQTLAEEWSNRSSDIPINSPYEALIMASIIEKETARDDERPEIAGVFARRLQKRMRLQTDPTVIYGIGPEFNGNITRKDLRTDTPYNTYTRSGLPPTPIALPGRASINAAVNPAKGSSLYFVATGLGDGSHKFSATKAEHDAAVQEYLRRIRSRRDD